MSDEAEAKPEEPKRETAVDRRKREAEEKRTAKEADRLEADKAAAAEVSVVETRNNWLRTLTLLQLVPALSPQYREPHHLTKWCELIEAAATNAVRALCSIPIRHFKTETTVHGIVWLLLRHPDWRIVFLTHSAEAALKWGKRIRQLAEATDVGPARGWDTIAEWRNKHGGGVVIMSAEQSKIGYDCDALIVDDPLDEHGAEDPNVREAVDKAITFYTARCMKSGKRGPVLLVASRFHPDDPIGRRLESTVIDWVYIHTEAIVDEGLPTERAFAPEVWPLEELKRTREELRERDPAEKIWWAQFQNDPKPLGSDLFGEPSFYTKLPDWSFRIGHGADLSFVAGAATDYFAMFSAKVYGRKLYVRELQRHKLDATMIETTAKGMLSRNGRGPIFSYMSGPEVGTAKLLRERGLPFMILHARYNKLVRAQRTIRRWNDGDVLLPEGAPWVRGFARRASVFRGHDKDQSDEIDALVALADGMIGSSVAGRIKTLGKAYSGFFSR